VTCAFGCGAGEIEDVVPRIVGRGDRSHDTGSGSRDWRDVNSNRTVQGREWRKRSDCDWKVGGIGCSQGWGHERT